MQGTSPAYSRELSLATCNYDLQGTFPARHYDLRELSLHVNEHTSPCRELPYTVVQCIWAWMHSAIAFTCKRYAWDRIGHHLWPFGNFPSKSLWPRGTFPATVCRGNLCVFEGCIIPWASQSIQELNLHRWVSELHEAAFKKVEEMRKKAKRDKRTWGLNAEKLLI